MPRISDKDRVSADQKQIDAATRLYRDWEQQWSPDILEHAYYGKQWEGDSDQWDQRRYVINLMYAAVEISKPSLLFQVPKYKVTARPNRTDDPRSDAALRAKLQEETLNTFVQDPKLGFAIEASLGLLDAQFRYAVMQVGYTADYIDNPNAQRPVMSEDLDESGQPKPLLDRQGKPIIEPKVTLRDESLFLKWIPARQCRISERNGNRLEDADWFAYFEWQYLDDLKQNPRYDKRAVSDLKATGRPKVKNKDMGSDNASQDDCKPGMVRVWTKWDFRRRTKRIWAEGAERYLQKEPYTVFPCAIFKFHEILGQWYPLPLAYNWMHPQNQLNDMREKRRQHRNRALPKYLRRAGAFASEDEFNKLMAQDEGISAEVVGDPKTAVAPVELASLDNAMFRDEAIVLEDFTRVTGISGESQQVAQSETATQANLIALMSQTRENAKRAVVGQWLGAIGRLILLIIREKMALPLWIQKAVDPYSPLAAQEAIDVARLWTQIDAEELGDIDNDITVDLSSFSPVQQAQERQDFLAFLSLITSPGVGMVLLASPSLFRRVAGMFNIHNERELGELAEAVQAAMLMMAQAQMQKSAGTPGLAAPGPTPGNAGIQSQLDKQLPVEQRQGMGIQ